MEYKEIIQSSLVALRSNLLRTGLTMLGIIIGISSVILIASVGQGAVRFITNELSAFGTNYFQITPGADFTSAFTGGSGEPLTLDDSNAIANANIPNIEFVAPFGFTSRAVEYEDTKKAYQIYGITETGLQLLQPDLLYGDFLTDSDSSSRLTVLGKKVSEDLFGENVNPVGESVRIDGIRFRVVGVSSSGGSFIGSFVNSSVIIPLEVFSDQIQGNDELVEIDIGVIDSDYLNQTMDEVEYFLREYRGLDINEDNDFMLTSFMESLSIVETVTTLVTTLIAGVSAISLVVGGVGVMNIMLVSVTERTKEIGLLKSIGAKDKDILMQFLIESVVMTLIGGVIGILLGISGAYFISLVANIPFIISVPWIIVAVLASTAVGIIFGIYPAKRAAALSPIDALRYE